jgi:hypothetical protein
MRLIVLNSKTNLKFIYLLPKRNKKRINERNDFQHEEKQKISQ